MTLSLGTPRDGVKSVDSKSPHRDPVPWHRCLGRIQGALHNDREQQRLVCHRRKPRIGYSHREELPECLSGDLNHSEPQLSDTPTRRAAVLANWNRTEFTTEYNFEITNVEGEAHPTFIDATHECLIRSGGGDCNGTGSTAQSVPAVVGAVVRIVSTFNVPVGTANTGVIRYAQAITRLVVTTPSQEEVAPFAQEVQAARVRCDSAPAMRNSTGCVIGDVEPIWDLRGYTNLDQYRRHVSLAQHSGLPGYPNDSGDGLPLNRIINQADKDGRRAITCGGVTGPRTGERDCDEYPMASTQQGGGGGTGNGVARTFDPFCGIRDTGITRLADINPPYRGLGWSVCLISNTQNRRAGSLQGWFYTKSRVINGDGFLVRAN